MPILYKIEPDLNLVYYIGFGTCTGSDFFKAEQLALRDRLRHEGMLILFDLQTVDEIDFTADDLKQAVAYIKGRIENNLPFEATAIVTFSNFAETFAKAFRLLLNDPPTMKFNVFRSTESASQWLGIPHSEQQLSNIKVLLIAEFQESLSRGNERGENWIP